VSTTSDILIVGGGIAGLTIALSAERRGLSVTILDSPRPGSASRAAAGMLAPAVEGLPASMLPSAIAARDRYPDFLADLRERTGVEVSLDRSGILELATAASSGAAGPPPKGAEWLDERSLASFEPAFEGHPGAWLHPEDGAVDNVALMTALSRAAERSPSIICLPADVLSVDAAGASALTRTSGRHSAGRLVLATGAWAGSLHGLPRALPVRPVRGQLLRLRAAPIRHVTYGAGGYLVPKGETVLVGATSEEAGFENETSLAGLSALKAIASRAIPALSSALVVDHWAGLRPMTPDGFPILGTDSGVSRLIYAVGYSRNGILFAPWAADQVARLLVGEDAPELAPMGLTRFG
jgi:thiazole synthase